MNVVDIDVIRQAVGLACRAPSLHNSQPWRWVADGPVLQLFADPARIGRSTDSTGREVIISCGAVLDHLRVAMAAAGWHANVDRFPNPDNLGHLASVDFTPEEFVTDAQRARAEAIRRRRTDRLALAAPPQWDSFEPALRDTLDRILAVLDVVSDDSRPHWPRCHAPPRNCAAKTRPTTPNFSGGQCIPSARFRRVRSCPRQRRSSWM